MAGNIQRRPDGKWRARYRDANHREHARHFPRKRDAEQWLASQEVAIARGEWVDPALSKITVGEWLPRWLALQVQLKPTTMVRYEVALRRQILPRWELVPLSRITHSDVSSWVHGLTDEGLAPATVRYHRVLSLALTAAVRDGRLVRNVAEGVPLPRVVATPKRFLTHDQVQALAEACGPYDTLIRVLAYAGLRWGELVALTACRIDLARRRIEVVEAITAIARLAAVWRSSCGVSPSSPTFSAARSKNRGRKFVLRSTPPSGAGKHQIAGGLPVQVVHQLVGREAGDRNRASLMGLGRAHDHPTVNFAGANVKAVQLMLGHASAAMTLDIYAGLFADDLDAVADRLDRAFVKLNADQMRTKRSMSRSDQTELPFENPPEQGTG